MLFSRFAVLIVALIGLGQTVVRATPIIVFSGTDSSTSAPGTGSNAAASSFDAAATLIGPEYLISFESPLMATNNPASQTIPLNAQVSVNGSNLDIANTPVCTVNVCGTNTTPGGSQWLDVEGASATFTFVLPIQYFGAYLGGLQGADVGQETFAFNDGSSETVNIPLLDGGFAFVGFTDVGASISSITITAGYDIISVDDVRYGPLSANPGQLSGPEPSSLALAGLGLLGITWLTRRNSKKYRSM